MGRRPRAPHPRRRRSLFRSMPAGPRVPSPQPAPLAPPDARRPRGAATARIGKVSAAETQKKDDGVGRLPPISVAHGRLLLFGLGFLSLSLYAPSPLYSLMSLSVWSMAFAVVQT